MKKRTKPLICQASLFPENIRDKDKRLIKVMLHPQQTMINNLHYNLKNKKGNTQLVPVDDLSCEFWGVYSQKAPIGTL